MKKYKNKLRYRSWHRGTKEADLLLGNFFDNHVNNMNNEDLLKYEKFLDEITDNDIMLIIEGKVSSTFKMHAKIIRLLQQFIKNENF